MANNLIQIKRSNTSASPSPSGNLVSGELAFSYNSNSLFIGAQTGATGTSYKIGGAKYGYVDQAGSPGSQTANAVVILDSNSFTVNTFTQGLVIQASGAVSTPAISAINAVANLTTLGGASNTELTTTWAIKTFVDAKIAQASNPQGTNGQFQYNNSGVLAGTNNMVFDNSTGQITVGNSSVNVQLGYTGSVNSLAHFHGDLDNYVQVIMQNSSNGTSASADYVVENELGDESGNYLDLGINSSNYNDPDFSAMGAGDSYLYAANNDLVIGTADAGELKFITGGTVAAQIRATIDAGGNVGIGNTAPNAKLQVTGTANVSGNIALGGITTFGANVILGTNGLSSNGGFGSNGNYLTSNGSATYWSAPATSVAGANTQIQFNDSGTLAGNAAFTFTKTTNTVAVGTGGGFQVGPTNAGTLLNTTQVFIASNSTVNSYLTVSGLYFNGVLAANSTVFAGSANNTTYVNGKTEGNLNVNNALTANSSTYLGGKLEANLNVNNALTANSSTYLGTKTEGNLNVNNALTSNNASFLGGVAAASYVQNTDSRTLSGNLTFSGAVSTFSGANVTVNGTNLNVVSNAVFGANLTVSGANLDATSALLRVRDISVSGNLTVTGTLTTIDSNNLQVKDAMIKVADQNTTTDLIDFGLYGSYGNSSANYFAGIYRDRVGSTMTSPLFRLFASNTEPTSIVDNTAIGYSLGTLGAYLTSGGLVSNSSVVNITANSTVSVALTANSLTLTTALVATSGGTGQNTYTSGDLLVANSGNALSKLTLNSNPGYVLQSNGTALVYATLDGGSF